MNGMEGASPSQRDLRLDVFRGIALIVIAIAHVPFNPLAAYMPGRFGYSDAAEIFVFVSGAASAIAFGRLYETRGFALATARVAQRVWQVYWVHVGVFLVLAASMARLGTLPDGEGLYIERLWLVPFFEDTVDNLIAFLTLTYVPNYFDILPMYLVILAMIPVAMALARISPLLALGASLGLWAIAQTGALGLPAEPWSERPWFFDPFAWQVLFFAGFYVARGTIPVPAFTNRRVGAALAIVAGSALLAWAPAREAVPALASLAETIVPLASKTQLGIARIVHFLALAYCAVYVVERWGWLLRTAAAGALARLGGQSLAVFAVGLVASQAMGVALDHLGRDALPVILVNAAGIAALFACAEIAIWFKSAPWKARRASARPQVVPAE